MEGAASPEGGQGRVACGVGTWRSCRCINEAPTKGAVEEDVSVGRIELEVIDDVSLTDKAEESTKAR